MTQEGVSFTNNEVTELLQYLVKITLTKDDVRNIILETVPPMIRELVPPMIKEQVQPMLNNVKHDIMDYVDRKDREYRLHKKITGHETSS